MIEIRFDPTSPDDRAAIRAMLKVYEDHEDGGRLVDYVQFVKRRGRNVAVKPFVLSFLGAVSAHDDIGVEVQEASDRVVVQRFGVNVAIVFPSGRVIFRAPPTDVYVAPLQETTPSDRQNGWITQLYLTGDYEVKTACELVNSIRGEGEL